VMSLSADKVGDLEDGDRLEDRADVEVTVCLNPNPRHPGANNKCVGKTYGYNPTVRAWLVLGPSGHKTRCLARKVGVIEFLQNVNRTLYVNVIGSAAMFPRGAPPAWRQGEGPAQGLFARLPLPELAPDRAPRQSRA
jgi:hypothetical protein